MGYSPERREAVLKKMLPPNQRSIPDLAREEGICEPTLYATGTVDIDKAKKKYGWDKDRLHGIKDAAHGGMGTGSSWTGVAPDGTVGINEDGEWIPQGHWEDLL
jgi:hypothetical protein